MGVLPANVGSGYVTGRLIQAVLDGSDPDDKPDGIPIAGAKITFKPSVDMVVNRTVSPPVMIATTTGVCTTDDDGVLVDPMGQPGVWLVASDDPDLDPTGWTYTVQVSAPNFPSRAWSITVPEGSTQDLATAVPVPSNPGTAVAAWQAAVDAVWEARDMATAEILQSRDDSVGAVETAAEVGSQLLDNRGNFSGTLNLSAVTRNAIVHMTMIGNITATLPTVPMVGHTITLELKQDATGSRTLTIPGAVTAYGIAITPAVGANALTEVMCFYDGVRWHARVSGLADAVPAGW